MSDVADALGVSANTVRRWTDVGRIAAYRSPGGHRRYLAEDVHALIPAGEDGQGGAQPGDFAELRRQSQDLRTMLRAGFDLMSQLAEDPHGVPAEAARMLCSITGAPRCDVYASDGEDLRLLVSASAGEIHSDDRAGRWKTADWVPVDGDPTEAPVTCLSAGDKTIGRRGRQALRRRGCGSLAWAPVVLRGELAGAIELTDAGDRDFTRHVDVLDGIARVCAEALAIQHTFDEFAERDARARELVDFSREVAQSHDFERFVLRFARRLLSATDAACVDVWRVGGGVIRAVVSCTPEGEDPGLRDKVLDTSSYPSLEHTLLDLTPLVISDVSDPRLGPDEVEAYARWGFASSVTMPLVAGGELVGLVDVYSATKRDWQMDLEFLTGICQLVAGVFDSTARLDEAREIARLREEVVELGAALAVADGTQDIAEQAALRLRRATGCEDCDVWWLQQGYIRCLASVDSNGIDERSRGRVLPADRYPSTMEALESEVVLIVNSLDDERLTDEERADSTERGLRSIASVPLVSNDQVVGLVDLYDARERDFHDLRWFLPAAARAIADALRNSELLAGLRRGNAAMRLSRAEIDAVTDELTGLYNHRYLHERLGEELHHARDLQRPLSVLFCDLDHFKGYNDANGHGAGDAVLREVARVIDQSVRNIDVAARYGGEEFVVVLVETDRDEAAAVAERIRTRIKAAGFTTGGAPLTVSIGIAGCPDDADGHEDLLDKAAWAMDLAKRRGRDQVAAFGEG